MPIRITLDNQEVIEADIALDDWNRAYQRALEGNTMIEIEGPSGVIGINPQRVNVVEAVDHQGAVGRPEAQPA
jgi:hypothetical protein